MHQDGTDAVQNTIQIRLEFLVRDTKDFKAKHPQSIITDRVSSFRIQMDGAVHFDDQTCLQAHEVDNEGPDHMLPADAEPTQTRFPDARPEPALLNGRTLPHGT